MSLWNPNDDIKSTAKDLSQLASDVEKTAGKLVADVYDSAKGAAKDVPRAGNEMLQGVVGLGKNIGKVLSIRTDESSPSSINLDAINRAAVSYANADPQLEALFKNAVTYAEHQSELRSDGTVFVKTGDIPFEWQRDSAAEVTPYLYFAKDPEVAKYLKAVVAGEAKAMQMHPYDAAVDKDYNVTYDRFELDSLLYPIELAWRYWKLTGDNSIFTDDVKKGFNTALRTMLVEQNHNTESKYTNQYLDNKPNGYTGMIWSGFRSSDGSMEYHNSIPENMMAVVVLKELAEIESDIAHDPVKAAASLQLSSQVDEGIKNYGIVDNKDFGKVYAYEVDGLGHNVLMDDANLPSLLSAPYTGYLSANDPIYQNTRQMLLSSTNPNYYAGRVAAGIGCANTPAGTIWPLALLAQGLTATDQTERDKMLKYLLASDPGDHYLHESFDANDQRKFTRKDFVWPNSLFAEFLMTNYMGYQPLPHAK